MHAHAGTHAGVVGRAAQFGAGRSKHGRVLTTSSSLRASMQFGWPRHPEQPPHRNLSPASKVHLSTAKPAAACACACAYSHRRVHSCTVQAAHAASEHPRQDTRRRGRPARIWRRARRDLPCQDVACALGALLVAHKHSLALHTAGLGWWQHRRTSLAIGGGAPASTRVVECDSDRRLAAPARPPAPTRRSRCTVEPTHGRE